MNKITRFEIKKLHGYKTVDLRLTDNTLILVGENGAGKTTILHMLYYLLSGQWASIARYIFEEVAITIAGKRHVLRSSDFKKPIREMDTRILKHLPPTVRRRFLNLLERREGQLVTAELEMLCYEYGIPLNYLLNDADVFAFGSEKKKGGQLTQILDEVKDELKLHLIYLPTYRRIEQELSLIFKGLDERELRNRRDLLSDRRNGETFVELVEFGMKDVDDAINQTLLALDKFARENLNNLTFGYLGDIVEGQYTNVDLNSIMNASSQTITNILNRIQEPILSSENKRHVREIIEGVKANEQQTEHSKVICHYFTKLMSFQEELEKKESRITGFCKICNEYMVDKEFVYDISKFSFVIRSKRNDTARTDIKLHNLSSGEKQIVSLFSHLYLSEEKRYFVLIDEPELSLSVPWQRRFLLDIWKGSFCAGLLAVTHSPFIYDNELKKYAHGLGEFII